MRRATAAVVAAALVPFAVALSGCGSETASSRSGAGAGAAAGINANLTQTQLLARLQGALATVTALHMKGKVADGGSMVSVDMQLNKDGSAQGTLVVAGAIMPIIRSMAPSIRRSRPATL